MKAACAAAQDPEAGAACKDFLGLEVSVFQGVSCSSSGRDWAGPSPLGVRYQVLRNVVEIDAVAVALEAD